MANMMINAAPPAIDYAAMERCTPTWERQMRQTSTHSGPLHHLSNSLTVSFTPLWSVPTAGYDEFRLLIC